MEQKPDLTYVMKEGKQSQSSHFTHAASKVAKRAEHP
jgi:hypothetical protein